MDCIYTRWNCETSWTERAVRGISHSFIAYNNCVLGKSTQKNGAAYHTHLDSRAHTRRHEMQIRDQYPRHASESRFRKPRTTWPPSIDHSTLLRYGMCRLGDLQSSAAASGTTQRRNKLSIPKRKRGTDHSCNTEPREYCYYLRNHTPVVVHSRLPQLVAVVDNNRLVPSTAINKDRKGYRNPATCVVFGFKSSNIMTVLNDGANFYGRVTLS